MDRPFKVEAGSAAKAAEDEARAQRSGNAGAAKQALRLTPRASSVPTPEVALREQFRASHEIHISAADGRRFDLPLPTQDEAAARQAVPEAAAGERTEPASAPPSLKQKLFKFLGWKH
ncbi:MAG TPA: hypothetical protein VFA54_04370 [Bryobacterales bacterium]|jgi:hypothetical protein|nr:hypothetical protein [Bryobacterales bacterium]